jgi:hypothetical protein
MIETICQNCGNQKSFEDSDIGRTFKCPNCSQPVKIQNLSAELSTEPLSKTNTFEEEISRAENTQKVDVYISSIMNFFEPHRIPYIKEKLLSLDASRLAKIQFIPMKSPQKSLMLSILFGGFGIDRFYIGDIGIGIVKMITLGGFGIWMLFDWFNIQSATRKNNFAKLQQLL